MSKRLDDVVVDFLTGASSTAERVRNLETLQTVAGFSFLADDIQHRVDQLSAFSIVALCPVVAGTVVAEHKVVWSEELTVRPRSDYSTASDAEPCEEHIK